MADITPELQQKLELLANISDTASIALGRRGKSALSQELMEKRLVRQLENELGVRKDEAQAIVDGIKAAEKRQTEDEKLLERRKRAQEGVEAGLKRLGGAFADLMKSSIANSSAIYGSDKAFSAAVPVLDTLSSTVKTVTEAMALMLSGISIFGFSLGRVSEGAAKFMGAATDIAFGLKKQQLEMAQKIVDSYQSISKAGVTFGGDLEQMTNKAHGFGMSLDQYGKFITDSSANLSQMGGTLQQASSRIMEMGKTALSSDRKLRTMYGSTEAMDTALSNYGATMSAFGIDTVKNQSALNKSSAAYLYSLKELQALTGLSADSLKKEAEARARDAAFSQAMGRIQAEEGLQVVQNMNNSLSILNKNIGPDLAKYVQEYIGTGGKVQSEFAQRFGSLNADLAKFGVTFVENAKVADPKLAAKRRDETFAENRAMLKGLAEDTRFTSIQYAASGDEVVDMQNNVTAALRRGLDSTLNWGTAQKEAAADTNKRESGASQAYNQALDALNEFKIEMENKIIPLLPKLGDTVTKLLDIQQKINERFGSDGFFIKAVDFFIQQLDKLANKISTDEEEKLSNQADTSRIKNGGANLNRQFIDKQRVRNFSQDQLSDLSAKEKNKLAETTVDFSGLKQSGGIRSGANTINGKPAETSKQLVDFMSKLKSDGSLGDIFINSLRDDYHKGFPNSAHNQGKAVDFTPAMLDKGKIKVEETPRFPTGEGGDKWYYTWNADDTKNYMDKIAQLAEKTGFKIKNLVYEDLNPENIHSVNGTTGPHFHMETYEKGGAGARSGIVGENGPELFDGPANITSASKTSQMFKEMNESLAKMVRLIADQNDYLEQMASYSA
jgi:hypothetical protein